MNINSGKVKNLKFTRYSDPDNIIGIRAVTIIMTKIKTLNAIIRYLNFNIYSPCRIIKERLYYVNCVKYHAAEI